VALNRADDIESSRPFVAAAETPLASALRLLDRAERGRWYAIAVSWFAKMRREKIATIAVICVLLLAALCIPTRCQVSCACTLEPVVRRHVAAPFAGPLEKSFVEPGDIITKDQLLAQMDGREIRWELSGVQAEHHRAAKERMGHMATQETGKAE